MHAAFGSLMIESVFSEIVVVYDMRQGAISPMQTGWGGGRGEGKNLILYLSKYCKYLLRVNPLFLP